MTVPLILPLLLLIFLIAEAVVVRSSRGRIPFRIHVSGTRGKSTVVRLIVAGLRAGGLRTLGKVTGIVPEMLLPDGTTQHIRRRGAARVHEQVRTLVRAGRMECDAIVIECMSIDPSLQRFESEVLRPTISVLTNAREDHEEAYAGLTPIEGPAAAAAAAHGILVMPGTVLDDASIGRLSHTGRKIIRTDGTIVGDGEFPEYQKENVALALQACITAGVPPAVALDGIMKAGSGSSPRVLSWQSGGVQRAFVDGFSVNDTRSAEVFVDSWRASSSLVGGLFLILNTRSDRPLRTRQFVRWIAARRDIAGVIVSGSHAAWCRRALVRAGVAASTVHEWSNSDADRAPARCVDLALGPATFVGMMNIAGSGHRIIEAFERIAHGH